MRHQTVESIGEGDPGAGDRRGPCPAIGLNDITINLNTPFPERGQKTKEGSVR